MKVYSEDQVMKAIERARFYQENIMPNDIIIKLIDQIELPSDEEIDNQAFFVPFDGKEEFYDKGFIKGAKWMKEQILNKVK